MKLLCMDCGSEIDPEGRKLICCPECGSQSIPADLDDSVTITITNHELRILTMWASNWARARSTAELDLTKPISVILGRLGTQTTAALSLSQEIADVRAAFPESEVKVYDGTGKELDL